MGKGAVNASLLDLTSVFGGGIGCGEISDVRGKKERERPRTSGSTVDGRRDRTGARSSLSYSKPPACKGEAGRATEAVMNSRRRERIREREKIEDGGGEEERSTLANFQKGLIAPKRPSTAGSLGSPPVSIPSSSRPRTCSYF